MENDFTAAQTIVVKVGTTSLTHDNGTIDLRKMDALARVLTDLENEGRKIVLVSSGAIGCGMHRLKMSQRPITLEEKQMTASVGQGLLMELYHRSFDSYYQNIGQILLTKDVFSNPIKRINARNTFSELMKRRIIPIVNENDPISTDEIEEERFGDNDRLSAMTAALIEADGLIILSDVDGLYTGDPGKEAQAERIDIVEKVTEKIMKLGGVSGSGLGTGGMVTKLKAVRYAANHGLETIITSGSDVNVLYRIMDGKPTGTLFRKNQKFYQGKEQEAKNV